MVERIFNDLAGVAGLLGDGKAAGHGVDDALAGHPAPGKARGGREPAELGVGLQRDRGGDADFSFARGLVRGPAFRAFHGGTVARVRNSSKNFSCVLTRNS